MRVRIPSPALVFDIAFSCYNICMKKKVKKFIFPGLGLIASAWFSIVFAFWGIIGFFATEAFVKKYIDTGKVKPVRIDFKDWQIQLHHWIWPGLILATVYFSGIVNVWPLSILGFASGVMFQDLYRDKKWHKVIYKKPPQ